MSVCAWHVSGLCKQSGMFLEVSAVFCSGYHGHFKGEIFFLWELTSFSYSSKIFSAREDIMMGLIKVIYFLLFSSISFHVPTVLCYPDLSTTHSTFCRTFSLISGFNATTP